VTASTGQTVMFSVSVAAVPDARYQWFRNGTAIRGATDASLTLPNATARDAARYSVTVTNTAGSTTSTAASLVIR